MPMRGQFLDKPASISSIEPIPETSVAETSKDSIMTSNYIKKVAIVGATGTVGKHIVEELLRAGKHEVTALTRRGAAKAMPAGVRVVEVDYTDAASLVAALQGQEALVITLPARVSPDPEIPLVEAAAAAGVPYIVPNEWRPDMTDEQLVRDLFMEKAFRVHRRIEELGRSAWTGFVTGFWYEFSLALGPRRFGLDWKQRAWAFFGAGESKMNVTTLPQTGRAVANFLALPIGAADGDGPSLAQYRNRYAHVSSFCVSQRDMFASVQRVSRTRAEDWTVQHVDPKQCYREGLEQLKSTGDSAGYVNLLYARMWYPDGCGHYEARHRLDNEALGLPEEDLDEFTKTALELVEAGYTY